LQPCGYKLASKFCKLLRNVWHASIELHVNLLLAVMTKTFCVSYVLVCQKVNERIRYFYVVQKFSFFSSPMPVVVGTSHIIYLFIYLFISSISVYF